MPAPDFAVEIAALEAAAASGELTIETEGERVTYRSTRDLLSTLDYFRAQASARSASGVRPAATVAVYDPE